MGTDVLHGRHPGRLIGHRAQHETDKKGKRHSYGTVTIEFIATDPAQQRQGAATHQLNALGKLADKWNITLRLRVMAHNSSPVNAEQLTAWYQGLGYTQQNGLYLNRLPVKKPTIA